MNDSIDRFDKNIIRAQNLHNIYNFLSSHMTDIIDPSDVLRMELAHIMSALDTYIHEVVETGIVECFLGNRSKSVQYNALQIPTAFIHDYYSSGNISSIQGYIHQKNSALSFQHPDKIAEALRLIHPNNIWEEIQVKHSKQASMIKTELKAIYHRRNQIVHESDIDPTTGVVWPIIETDIESSRTFISDIVHKIHDIIF